MQRLIKQPKPSFKSRWLPLILTVVTFVILSFLIYLQILVLNLFSKDDIVLQIRLTDVLVGLTIYLKTSVDFAIFIGNLMANFPGWKNRVAIEIGTALGNALGTMIILTIWNFFREVEWLLAIMVFIAALVLFRLAEDGLSHAKEGSKKLPVWVNAFVRHLDLVLSTLNRFTSLFLKYIIPNTSMRTKKNLTLWGLFGMAATVPFILGLDDFAGYVPVFSIVNVFGFAIGVFAGHMILNASLFISPNKTIAAVKEPVVSLLGSIAFIGLAFWGLFEVYKILFLH